MSESYYVRDEDGLFRMFDVSHDGLEDAIETANELGVDVLRDRDGTTETVWSFEDAGDDAPWDGFNSDAEADADALASAGWGTDEDYGGCDDYGCGFYHRFYSVSSSLSSAASLTSRNVSLETQRAVTVAKSLTIKGLARRPRPPGLNPW